MSTVGAALTTWEEFLQLADLEDGSHYELHDGEVVVVPRPRPIHIYIQSLLVEWLTTAAQGRGRAHRQHNHDHQVNGTGPVSQLILATVNRLHV